jgi:hypothetical protein
MLRHVRMMCISIIIVFGALVRLLDISTPKEKAVANQGANLKST